jgi:hypothetical protein
VADLEYQVRDHVATILLNRPERRNAITLAMVGSWADALAEAQRDPEVRVSVVTGAGGSLCSGQFFLWLAADPPGRPLSPGPREARAGLPTKAVAGTGGRGPLTANGIYQMIRRRGYEAGLRCSRTRSGTISATPGWTGPVRRAS